jgi:hypothetical protein
MLTSNQMLNVKGREHLRDLKEALISFRKTSII